MVHIVEKSKRDCPQHFGESFSVDALAWRDPLRSMTRGVVAVLIIFTLGTGCYGKGLQRGVGSWWKCYQEERESGKGPNHASDACTLKAEKRSEEEALRLKSCLVEQKAANRIGEDAYSYCMKNHER